MIVELCPDAINAMAKRMGANLVPRKEGSSSCATLISATSVLPVLKKAVAANTSIAALTKKARFKAIVLSIKFSFNAFFMPVSSRFIFLVCTNAECRYKLCGITVAPIIPIAIYSAVSFGIVGTKPVATSLNWGLTKIISIRNEIPMTAISAMIKASILRMPRRCKYKKRNVSSTVINTPQISGKPVSNCNPIAIPSISARSHAAIAISAKTYNA